MKIRVIPTNVHSAVDHVVGPALIAAPTLLGLEKTSPEGLVPRVNGIAAALYSNLTDYELSLKNVIPMKLHLARDGRAQARRPALAAAHAPRRLRDRHGAAHADGGAAVADAPIRAGAEARQ